MRRIVSTPAVSISGGFLLLLLLIALLAPLLAPYDPYAQDLSRRLLPPIGYPNHDAAHLLGTDGFGRDYLSRLVYGTRISLLIGFSVVFIAGLIGTTIGMIAGYFGGKVDQVLMFVINTRLAMPVFLAAMAVVVVFGASLTSTVLTLGLFLWDRFAVVVRSATQQVAAQDFVLAAQSIGFSNTRIIFKEILPNILSVVVVIATLEMGSAILLEAALSFLGFGVQEPTASWGLMLSQAREQLFFDAWLIYLPGFALLSLVLAINVFGDGLRDLLGARGRA
ncbi:MAG: ABC transporter permease [Proteobacteria bacterium]|nr:ABC transporter permease [Pseudomonadota bacterium]